MNKKYTADELNYKPTKKEIQGAYNEITKHLDESWRQTFNDVGIKSMQTNIDINLYENQTNNAVSNDLISNNHNLLTPFKVLAQRLYIYGEREKIFIYGIQHTFPEIKGLTVQECSSFCKKWLEKDAFDRPRGLPPRLPYSINLKNYVLRSREFKGILEGQKIMSRMLQEITESEIQNRGFTKNGHITPAGIAYYNSLIK